MSKEEYAQLHYLLAKTKYELAKNLSLTNKDECFNEIRKAIRAIEVVERIMMLDGNN